MSESTKVAGLQGEQFIAEQLEKAGYTIRARNYRKTYGEIDLVAEKASVIAFVEVKFRKKNFIDPAELIPLSKQAKIIKTALAFLSEHNMSEKIARFDVALICDGTFTEWYYIESAFCADE
jgi:putative endonuclease